MDKQNFEQRVRILWPAMVRTARCLVRDASDAEDAAAQAVLRCWQNLPRLRDENAFEAWAMRACVNEAKTLLRKQRRVQPRSDLLQTMAHSPGDARSEGSWSGGGFAGCGWPGCGLPGDGWPGDGWPGDGWPGDGWSGDGVVSGSMIGSPDDGWSDDGWPDDG